MKTVTIVLDGGDGSSYVKYFSSEEAAEAYLEKYEGDDAGGYPQEVDVQYFQECVNGDVLVPKGGFD